MPVSHQLYDHLAVRFTAGIKPCGQIADKIKYLILIFTKPKAAVQCLHDCLAFMRRAIVRCACNVARLSQVQLHDNHANFMSCHMVCGVLAAAVLIKRNTSSLHNYCAAVLWHFGAECTSVSSWDSHTNTLCVLQQPCMSCGSRVSL